MAQRERLNRELEIAREVQEHLFPQRLPPVVGLDYFGQCRPAREVGGDYYDFLELSGGKLGIAIGDVSGKGVGAALMMARTHSTFRSLASRPDARELFSEPAKAAGIVNDALAIGNDSCMFVTLLLATFDIQKRQLTYVRAGHIPPFHRNGANAIERLAQSGRDLVQSERLVGNVNGGFDDGLEVGIILELGRGFEKLRGLFYFFHARYQ